MRNVTNILCLFTLIFVSISCKKNSNLREATSYSNTNNTRTDSIRLIKDTILFVNSSEGENVKFSINNFTKDSIIESEALGETGKSIYKFIFNKKLKTGECNTYIMNLFMSIQIQK